MANLTQAQSERLIYALVEHYKTMTFDNECLTDMIINGLPKDFTPLNEYTEYGLVELYAEQLDSNIDEDFLAELREQLNKQ